jgi:branched-chain amino acid transport system ATP-binding protein
VVEVAVALLQTKNLTKHFGESRAVDGVDMVVDAGEFVSLIGSNGAGKTTLVNLITAYLQPDAGEVYFRGRDICTESSVQRIRLGIVRSFQLVNLFDTFRAIDNVALAIFSRERKSIRAGAPAEIYRSVYDEAHAVLREFGLDTRASNRAGALPHGERKLLDVAVAYALRPMLLFLDEPTSGVSTHDKHRIMDTIAAVVRGGKITAVIIEHDMDVVFKYSDRIIAMHQGRILAEGSPDAIRANAEVALNLLGTTTTAAV